MKHFNLLMASILAMLFGGGVGAFAQTDVTSQYLDNADFSQSTPVTVNVCGYKADISKSANKLNGQNAVYWAQDVDGWTVASDKKDGSAGAVFAYGSEPQLKGNSKSAPATNPSGEATGNALGIFAVWGGTIQYTQDAKAALPIGRYDLTYTYYNQSATDNVTNLIGFVEDGGTTHYGSNTTFTVGAWTTETISFVLTAETSGKFSIGYKSLDGGSGKNPMLFIDNITLKYTDPLAAAKAAYQTALDAAKAALENADYTNVTGGEKTSLQKAIEDYGTTAPTTEEGYTEATTALTTATTAFTGAKAAYDNYAAKHADADAIAKALGVSDSYFTAPTTAAEATAYFDNLNVAEFNAVKTGYANDLTTAYDTDWTVTGFETKIGEHWSGNTAKYLDHWNAGSEAISATKTITLPAGKWVLKASGRSNVIAGTFTMKVGDATVAFPSKGGSGLGITTDGEASFDESKTYAITGGRGWEWRFIPLTLTEETEVTVTIAANLDNSWAGFSDFAILTDDATKTAVKQEAAEKALAAAKETLKGTIANATALNVVLGDETLKTAIATAQGVYDDGTSTKDALDGANTTLAEQVTTATAKLSATNYYIQNVGSGKYLAGANSWGTQASVVDEADQFTLNFSNGGFKLTDVMLSSNDKNLGDGLFTDNAGVDWTIAAVDGEAGVFTIAYNGKYLAQSTTAGAYSGYTAELVDNVADAAKWYLLTRAEAIAKLATATEDSPIPATFLIGDADFSRNHATTPWSMEASNQTLSGGADDNRCVESYHSIFTLTQTIEGVPNGKYKLSAQGFYRQDGSDNDNLPYFFLNDTKVTFPVRDGSENRMSDASTSFTSGSYKVETDLATVTDGTITLGAKNESNVNLWCIWDNFDLTYYGPVDYSEYATTLATEVAKGKEIVDEAMNAEVKTALQTAIAEYETKTESTSYSTEDAWAAAINAMKTATANATASIAAYATAKAYLDAAATLDDAGKASYAADETVAAVQTAYNDGTLESVTDVQVEKMNAALVTAAKAQTTEGSDWTLAIINPSFEKDIATGWTQTGTNAIQRQNNTSFGKTGDYYAERWQPNSSTGISQTLTSLPAGVYELSVRVKARGVTSASVFAGDYSTAVTVADEENDYTVQFALDTPTDVAIGFKAQGKSSNNNDSWVALDNFTLKLVSTELPDVTAVTGKMNKGVETAQATAIETYNNAKTVANYNAAVAAVAAAQASVDAYAKAKATLDNRAELLKTTNFYTADALNTFYTSPLAAYNEGTMEDATATALEDPYAETKIGWHNSTQVNAFMGSAWGFSDYTKSLYVNTWSTEGDTDGSDFKVPFYEYWTGDANKLGAATWTGSVTGLDPDAYYNVSALVRVRLSNDQEAPAAGISMQVADGAAVSIAGTQIGESQLYLGNYSATGKADADGNLNVKFIVADGTNVSWLAFQNVKYEAASAQEAYESALATAKAALANTDYANVTGDEKTTLETDVETYGNVTSDYETATTALTTATTAFTAAKEAYDNYANNHAAAEAIATALGVSDSYFTAPTTAAEATAYFDNLNVAEYNAVKTGYANDATKTYDKGWTSNNFRTTQDQHWSGNASTTYSDKWSGDATTITATKTITLPAGKWVLKASGRGAAGTTLTMEAGGTTVTFPSKGDTGYGITTDGTASFEAPTEENDLAYANGNAGRGWEWRFIPLTLTAETEVTVTVSANLSGNTWAGFSDFAILTDDADKATFDDLNAAITAAGAHTLGFDAGEYAPYNNVDALKALAAAKAIDQTAYNTKDAVKAVTDALTAATWTANSGEVNGFYDGSFEYSYDTSSGNVKPTGWHGNEGQDNSWSVRYMYDSSNDAGLTATSSGKGMMTKYDAYYGSDQGYTLPLNANTVYRLTFKYAGWNETGNNTTDVVVTDADGNTYAVNPTSFKPNGAHGESNADQWSDFNGVFKTGEEGDYVIHFNKEDAGNQRQVVFGDFVLKIAVADEVTLDDAAAAAPEANVYANVTYDRTLYTGWNSIVLPFDATLTELGAEKAYSFAGTTKVDGKDNSYTINLTSVDDGTLKANTPYIVKMAADKTGLSFEGKAVSPAGSLTAEDGANHAFSFQGTYVAYEANADDNPILKGDYIVDEAGFVKAAGGNQIGAFRAWLDNADETGAAKVGGFTIDGEEVTGIRALELGSTLTGKAYNLQGQQVENPRHGVFIINGRKVVVK